MSSCYCCYRDNIMYSFIHLNVRNYFSIVGQRFLTNQLTSRRKTLWRKFVEVGNLWVSIQFHCFLVVFTGFLVVYSFQFQIGKVGFHRTTFTCNLFRIFIPLTFKVSLLLSFFFSFGRATLYYFVLLVNVRSICGLASNPSL